MKESDLKAMEAGLFKAQCSEVIVSHEDHYRVGFNDCWDHLVIKDDPDQHPDDAAVDKFAAAMKEKLALAREKGRGGWEHCDPANLSAMLHEHVAKGDPRDVANFCMFLWNLGQPITPQPLPYPTGCAVNTLSSRMCERGTPSCVVEHEAQTVQPSNETLAAKITGKAFDMIAEGYDGGLVKKEVARILGEAQPVQPAACQYCDGTGDVHGIEGEWRGECSECKPAVSQVEPVDLRELFERLLFGTYAGKDSYYNDEQIKHGCFERAQELVDVAKRMNIALYTKAPAVAQEPVGHQYQSRDGVWNNFINQKHYEDTVADGTWPIRSIYTESPAAAINEQMLKLLTVFQETIDRLRPYNERLCKVIAEAECEIEQAAEAEKAKGGGDD